MKSSDRRTGNRARRRGLSVVYMVFVIVVLAAFVSLAVDMGRWRLAGTEVQVAADAAARAGADSLPTSTNAVLNHSVESADLNGILDAANTAAGRETGERTNPGLELDTDDDIEFGLWNPTANTFTKIVDKANTTGMDERRGANAVHVMGRRTEDRGNSIPLIFGPVIGVFHKDVEREATAYVTGGPDNFFFVGIDFVKSNGNKATLTGGVASDGDITPGNGDIIGDARPGRDGGKISTGPNSVITGWTAPLSYKLATDPRFTIRTVPVGTPAVPSGNNPTLVGSSDPHNPREYHGAVPSKFTLQGYVRIYVDTGTSLNLTPTITYVPATNDPKEKSKRLEVNVTTTAITSYSTPNGNSQIYAHVFAPKMDFSLRGTADLTGWVVAKSITYKGNSTYTYDNSKNDPTPFKVTLVR